MSAPDSPPATDAAWHALAADAAAARLQVDAGSGLAAAEVTRRQREHGPNRMSARRGRPAWQRFLLQFHAPLLYILLAAVAVTAFLGEWVDSAVIFAVVLVNAVVGFLQEAKAEQAIAALSRLLVTQATVRRDGRRQRVPAEELVPGDVVLLEAGDRVPADLRLLTRRGLQVDESALTGESVPVLKDPAPLPEETVLADRKNLAFAGSLVTAGTGEGVVFAIGDATETGRIARLISGAVDLSTPLTRKIAQFSRLLLWLILSLAAATFLLGVLRGQPAVEVFMAAVALAVAAIPEGLPAAVTITLAVGVKAMARRRAIIRKLPAVETLGSTTVICSDKTGTLTENQMTVQRAYAGGRWYEFTGAGYEPKGEVLHAGQRAELAGHPALAECLRAGVLCNDSLLLREDNRPKLQGDPTEGALIVAAEKAGLLHADTHGQAPRLDMIPFESEHMFRATLHDADDRRMIYKVGAVERLLPRCQDMLGPDGRPVPPDADAVRAAVEAMAAQGLRVLAFARRPVAAEHDRLEHGHVQEGLTFLGLQGMMDPPRAEAVAAVAQCRRAGIRVKMITGDHAVTARAIAGQIGLADEGREVQAVTGAELGRVPDDALPELADATAVFARVAPEQKLRLVRALQARGHIVAMTGDGVNDAPALKQADIGIAMGITGTEVAKGAADMVLTDDNFASIEAAVEEGRGVFDNLRKFIIWTLPTNAGQGIILMTAIVLGLTLPLLPVQLLWVNMSTALLLGLMLVFEPKEADIMARPPRDPRRPLMTFPLFMRTGLVSLIMLGGAWWIFFHEWRLTDSAVDAVRTAVVNTIVLVQTAYLFNCRSLRRSPVQVGLFSNPWVWAGAGAMLAAQALFTYAPFMHRLFHTAPLEGVTWLRIAGVAALAFAAVELEKWLRFRGRPGPED